MHPGLQTQVSIHDEFAGFGFGFRFAFWPWLFGRDVCRLWGGYDRDIQSVYIDLGKGMSAGRQNGTLLGLGTSCAGLSSRR